MNRARENFRDIFHLLSFCEIKKSMKLIKENLIIYCYKKCKLLLFI